MRKNQVTIILERFGDEVPEALHSDQETIRVYADSNNVYEAVSAAYMGLLAQIRQHQGLPENGTLEAGFTTKKQD